MYEDSGVTIDRSGNSPTLGGGGNECILNVLCETVTMSLVAKVVCFWGGVGVIVAYCYRGSQGVGVVCDLGVLCCVEVVQSSI